MYELYDFSELETLDGNHEERLPGKSSFHEEDEGGFNFRRNLELLPSEEDHVLV